MIERKQLGRVTVRPAEAGDDRPGAVESRIELGPACLPDALAGLEESSHMEDIFDFDGVDTRGIARGPLRQRAFADQPMRRGREVGE